MVTSSLIALAASSAGEAAGKGADHGSGGLPQLDTTTFASQIFWLIVAIVVLYWLMSKVALPRIASVLEERADAIADDLDRAEELKRKAEDAEAAYEQALKDARAKAQSIAAETRAEINADVDAAIAKADAEIAARAAEGERRIAEIRESAMASVTEVANDTAVAVVDAVMPGVADADAVKAAVGSELG
ncbi:MAG: F0F1 ATP synthase subunit B' [Pseudomonadota bacterium]